MLNLNLDRTNNRVNLGFSKTWWLKGVAIAIACLMMVVAIAPQPSMAALPTKSAIKDARIILRNALPIDNDILRDLQRRLEQMPRQSNLKRWSSLKKDIETISQSLTQNQIQLIKEVSGDRQALVSEHLTSLKTTDLL